MRFLVLCFTSVFIAVPAFAACTAPAGVAGTMEYFGAPENIFKFCNGSTWVKMGGMQFTTVSAATSVTCPAGYAVLTCNSVAPNMAGNLVCSAGIIGSSCSAPCGGGPYYVTATCYK